VNGQLATLGTQDTGRRQTKGKTQHNMWWTLLCLKKHTNNINEPSYKQLEVKTNQTSLLCVNHNGHHNTELSQDT
jgi:hypothetical protein